MQSSKEEFLKILSAYQGILHKVGLIYFKNQTDRQDNFQETVYQLWKSFPTLKKKNSLGSWIYAVSINTAISRVKKVSRIDYLEKPPDLMGISTTWDQMIKDEEQKLLIEAIQSLGEIDRSVIFLYLEEKSYEEISEILGLSKSNVGVRINRAKEVLRRKLKPWEYGK